ARGSGPAASAAARASPRGAAAVAELGPSQRRSGGRARGGPTPKPGQRARALAGRLRRPTGARLAP
nr:hypothetical protein [Tanacetum cinerariifolium]